MDELEKAMQDGNFTLVDDYNKPSIILFGKHITGSHSENGNFVEDFKFRISQAWNNGIDFTMHHIHSYERLKLWLNQNTSGGYNYFLDLYKNRKDSVCINS
jgi:hypothetical protein